MVYSDEIHISFEPAAPGWVKGEYVVNRTVCGGRSDIEDVDTESRKLRAIAAFLETMTDIHNNPIENAVV